MSTLFSHFFCKNNEIRPQEADFTEVLSTIVPMPKMLYFHGKLPEKRLKMGTKTVFERPKVLAIVGSRKPTKYGEEIAYKLAKAAAERGVIVISGLAYGIDSVAARGALAGGGVTVAVLGTPIDQISPRAHLGLAQEIVEKGGCILSELAPGEQFFAKTSFLRRNRLISGLADAVMIPEAAERSGSLNTAAHALEQGREVFAAPGDISRLTSKGCNRLIRQGATPYLEPADILDLLCPQPKRRDSVQVSLFGDNVLETRILRMIDGGVADGEELARRLEVTVMELNQALTMLEIKGQIRSLGANQWALG